MENLKEKRVLVTGGSGFIPSHLCRRLVRLGAQVYITTRYDSVFDNIRLTHLWDRIIPIEADLRNPDSLRLVAEIRPHIVFHFAAYNHVGGSLTHVSEAIDVNCKGSVNLLEAYEDYERFIYISSSEVYGDQERVPFTESMLPNPVSPYAIGKLGGENYALMKGRAFGKPVVVIRPFNAFGPFQSTRAIIAELIVKCLRGEEIRTTEGIQTRDFNFVENLIDGIVISAEKKGIVGEIINLGSGYEISIKDLTLLIHDMTHSHSKIRIGELKYRRSEIWRMAANSAKAKACLEWTPKIDLKEGLRLTIDWYKKYIELFHNPKLPLHQLCNIE